MPTVNDVLAELAAAPPSAFIQARDALVARGRRACRPATVRREVRWAGR
jgi:hypothetical protein